MGLDAARLALDLAEILREAEAGRIHPLLLDGPRPSESLLEGLDDVDPAFRESGCWRAGRPSTTG